MAMGPYLQVSICWGEMGSTSPSGQRYLCQQDGRPGKEGFKLEMMGSKQQPGEGVMGRADE